MNIEDFLLFVKNTGYQMNVVFDIGACKGNWSQTIKKKVLPETQFILFEANPAYDDILKKTGFRYFNTVLSNPERKFVDFYNGTNTGDSYYKETTGFYDNQSSIKLECSTLDNIVKNHSLPSPQLIKIDTQGSELDILQGSEQIISTTDFIYTECPIIKYNQGAPSIQEYLDYFKSKNFIPVDLLEIHKLENVLVQIDIMFVKKEIKEHIFGKNKNIRPFV